MCSEVHLYEGPSAWKPSPATFHTLVDAFRFGQSPNSVNHTDKLKTRYLTDFRSASDSSLATTVSGWNIFP